MKSPETIPLRYGPEVLSAGRFPLMAAFTLREVCWDPSWQFLLALNRLDTGPMRLTAYRPGDGAAMASFPLPPGLLPASRLFRRGRAVCLLAGRRAPRDERFVLRLDHPSRDARFVWEPIPPRKDYDTAVAPTETARRRRDLMAINPTISLESVNCYANLPHEIDSKGAWLRPFPVTVGEPGLANVRFSPNGRVVAIGGDPMTVAWFQGGIWRKECFMDAVEKVVRQPSNEDRDAYSAFAGDRLAVFGVRWDGVRTSVFWTVRLDLSGGVPRIGQITRAVYAPPILQVA